METKENLIQKLSFDFAKSIMLLYRRMYEQRDYVISKQLLRSATSIGANVEEAIAAQSKKDFVAKLSIASKEARESHYWLRLMQETNWLQIDYTAYIGQCTSIINVLTKIIKTTKERL